MNQPLRMTCSPDNCGYIVNLFVGELFAWDSFWVGEDSVHISFYSLRYELPYSFIGSTR